MSRANIHKMKTTLDISEGLAKCIFDTYTSDTVGKGDAMTAIFEGYMHLRVVALATLKGVFTSNELNLIIDNLNGTLIDAAFKANPSVLAAHIEDGDMYDKLGDKWRVDIVTLCEKVRSLNHLQVFFLNDEILRWWDKQFCSLEDFVKMFDK